MSEIKKQDKKEKDFYSILENALKHSRGDLYSETVLSGPQAGRKVLLNAEQIQEKETDGIFSCGQDRVFRERIGRSEKLVICGGGHVSVPIIRIAGMLGFSVTVLEDRPKFADNARRAGADQVFCEPFREGLSRMEGDSDTWFVIVTRGHRYDEECLELILAKPHAYVGMMGSRRRVAIVKDQLEERGVNRALLDSVHTPIGLAIGAQTPEEIAVSVMAEMIQEKRKNNVSGGYSQEVAEALFRRDGRKKVVATIISRKGSAPRDVGTKMVIFEDGETADTIGGGCVEHEIMQKAFSMMRFAEPVFCICTVNMTADAAEDEGMVCGGIVEVMMEMV